MARPQVVCNGGIPPYPFQGWFVERQLPTPKAACLHLPGSQGSGRPLNRRRREAGKNVANERVVRYRSSELHRLRVMRETSQEGDRSVDRRNYGPGKMSREIPKLQDADALTICGRQYPAQRNRELCGVLRGLRLWHGGTHSAGSWEIPCSPVGGATRLSFSFAPCARHNLRQEPYAGNPLVRICAGGTEQSVSLPRRTPPDAEGGESGALAPHRFWGRQTLGTNAEEGAGGTPGYQGHERRKNAGACTGGLASLRWGVGPA
jgi:hypothetical protein